MSLTLPSAKGAPLELDEFEGNFTYLKGLIDALTAAAFAAGETIQTIEFTDANAQALRIVTNRQSFGPFALPPRANLPRGGWTVGVQYNVGDIVTQAGSSYVALQAHVAGAAGGEIGDEIDAGNLAVLAEKGSPGYVFQGEYDQTRAYAANDAVFDPVTRAMWIAGAAIPAFIAPTSGGPDDAWLLSAVQPPLPADLIDYGTTARSVAAELDDLRARIAALEAAP